MAHVIYHVVVPFDRHEGTLTPGEAIEAARPLDAYATALAIARGHAGVVAFSRTGDPATGEFSDATVIVSIGEVDLGALVAG